MAQTVREHVDVVVVGSGFGGSVSAYRLAEAGRSVVVLERGKAFPPGSFPRDPAGVARNFWDPGRGRHGMFDIWSFRGLEAVVAAGLGGGSLVYANVLIRKDERWFVTEQPVPGGGYEDWPVTRADLDPHYDRVERMLGGQPYPYADTTPKTAAYRAAAERAGLDWHLPLLAVSFRGSPDGPAVQGAPIAEPAYGNVHGLPRRTCVLCGECDVGCNDGAKNTLDHTYLSAAAHHGADLRTRHEAVGIAPRAGGGYVVRFVVHTEWDEGTPTDLTALPVHEIDCDRLILAAGTLGTSNLLLRNRSALAGLSQALGTRFSGNGDVLGILLGANDIDGRPLRLEGSRGPVITSAVRVPDAVDVEDPDAVGWPRPRGHYVEDAGYPVLAEWLVELSRAGGLARRGARFAAGRVAARLRGDNLSSISRDLAVLIGEGELARSSVPLLGMGRDVPDGVIRLRDGGLDVDWTTTTSLDYVHGVQATMRRLADELEADYHDNPLWRLQRLVTVHPLGGAPMGRDPSVGVCDPFGEVYGHPGLHVLDGAVLPGPVGPNPSLTIAAVADRACDRITAEPRRRRRRSPEPAATPSAPEPDAHAGVPPAAPEPGATGLRFTEEMKGWVGWGESDPAVGARVGRSRAEHLAFRLTIELADVARFVADPEHEGTARGWVAYDLLGGRRPVRRGWFNLFTMGDDADRRAMRYRLHLDDAGGNPVTLVGVKDVHDDPGADVWRDTTTLAVRLVQGHVGEVEAAARPALAAGIITIAAPDFARQLTTFRATGPHPVRAMVAFNRLFLGQLWAVYLGRRPGRARHRAAGGPG